MKQVAGWLFGFAGAGMISLAVIDIPLLDRRTALVAIGMLAVWVSGFFAGRDDGQSSQKEA